jgi:hypothetical protein
LTITKKGGEPKLPSFSVLQLRGYCPVAPEIVPLDEPEAVPVMAPVTALRLRVKELRETLAVLASVVFSPRVAGITTAR